MKPIIFENKEYKDKLTVQSDLNLTIRERISLLFSPKITIKHEVYCKEVMPRNRATGAIVTTTYLDNLKIKYRTWRYGNQMLEATKEAPIQRYYRCTHCSKKLDKPTIKGLGEDVFCKICDKLKESIGKLDVAYPYENCTSCYAKLKTPIVGCLGENILCDQCEKQK